MKRCKICQNRFEPRFSTLERVCWDVECKSSEALQKLRKIKDEEVKFERKRLKQMKSELMTIKQWVIKAQGSFNKYIRLRDEHKGCVSCGANLTRGIFTTQTIIGGFASTSSMYMVSAYVAIVTYMGTC